MCAIVDMNIVRQLWDKEGNPAGQGFRKAVDTGRFPLTLGGSKFRNEVLRVSGHSSRLRPWLQQLQSAGRLQRVNDSDVDTRMQELVSSRGVVASSIRSDDHHILALAQISGARLLFTNDKALAADFGNVQIIGSPRGRVYSTNITTDFNKSRRDLLARTDLCSRNRSV